MPCARMLGSPWFVAFGFSSGAADVLPSGLARDFIAPVTLASVAVPFCDDRGHVVSGKHVLRLWTNRHDVLTMPPGQPPTPVPVGAPGDGGVELHVEFDSFAGTVAASVPPSMWSLASAMAQGSAAGVAVAPAVHTGASLFSAWPLPWHVVFC
jgi:hypothetical protein